MSINTLWNILCQSQIVLQALLVIPIQGRDKLISNLMKQKARIHSITQFLCYVHFSLSPLPLWILLPLSTYDRPAIKRSLAFVHSHGRTLCPVIVEWTSRGPSLRVKSLIAFCQINRSSRSQRKLLRPSVTQRLPLHLIFGGRNETGEDLQGKRIYLWILFWTGHVLFWPSFHPSILFSSKCLFSVSNFSVSMKLWLFIAIN